MRKIVILASSAIIIITVILVGVNSSKLQPRKVARRSQTSSGDNAANSQLKTYTSKDLKITLEYPASWFLNEKDFDIMISSYGTKIGENSTPDSNQIKMFINIFSNCFPNYEQDLIYPGCGEGGEGSKNTIISKVGRVTQVGTFYEYIVRTPRKDEFVYYILYKDDNNILQIEKHPDPSQYEKEFDDIVNSIKFL